MAFSLHKQIGMRSILLGSLFSLALTAGCTSLSDSEARSGIGHNGDEEGCKIEGSQIGKVGLVLEHDGVAVTFTSWQTKAGEPNEFVGFTYTLSGASSVVYTVKAGTKKYIDDATTYVVPGTQAISNVDFCDCDEGDGDGSGSGTDNDGPIFL